MLDDLLGWLAGSVLEAAIEAPVELLDMTMTVKDQLPHDRPSDLQPGSVLRLR